MTVILKSVLAAFLTVSSLGVALPPSGRAVSASDSARSASFQPCRWWRYDFQGNGYKCDGPASRIEVYESRDVDRIVRTLEQRIAELEARVASLESEAP